MITVVTEKQLKDFLNNLYVAGKNAQADLDDNYAGELTNLKANHAALTKADKVDLPNPPAISRVGFRIVDPASLSTGLSAWYDGILNELERDLYNDDVLYEDHEPGYREKITKRIYYQATTQKAALHAKAVRWKQNARLRLPGVDLTKQFAFKAGKNRGRLSLYQLIDLCFVLYTNKQMISLEATLNAQRYTEEDYNNNTFLAGLKEDKFRYMVVQAIAAEQQDAVNDDEDDESDDDDDVAPPKKRQRN